MRDKQPCPDLKPGAPLAASYVDNLTLIAGTYKDAATGLALFERKAQSKDLSLHPGLIGKGLESLGLVFSKDGRVLSHQPARLWRFYKSTRLLAKKSWIRSGDLEVWLGHAVNIFRLAGR
eukprot:7397706-Karenia_brevis.AAC.1